MRKIFLGFIFLLSVSFAEINEYMSDVYFANGINTDKLKADEAIKDIKLTFETAYPDSFTTVNDWKVSLNRTQGIGIDLYEAMLQKIEEEWTIKYSVKFISMLNYTYGGIVKKVAKKVAKDDIEKFTQKEAERIARYIFVHYRPGDGTLDGYKQAAVELLFQKVFSKIIDDLIMQVINIPEEDIKRREQADIKTQFTAYTQSIKDGHGVVVIAHSQGNLFTNVVYDMFTNHWLPWDEDTEWMKKYFSAFAVGSPANSVLGEKEPFIAYHEDIVSLASIGLGSNLAHPNPDICKIDNIKLPWCFKAHYFLGSYMKEKVTRNHILGFIRNRVDEQTYNKMLRPSQWKPKKEIGCVCEKKYIEITHQFEPGDMDKILKGQEIKNFSADAEGKIYTVDDTYVRAENDGETIEKIDEGEVCLKLKSSDTTLGEIKGKRQGDIPKAFNGAIDMFLTWNYECDIDMNLEMTASPSSRGAQYIQQDIKDIEGYGKEHTYIDTVYHTYPGDHYNFEADGNKLDESTLEEETLAEEPIEIRALLETPTGSYFRVWEAKSFGQLDLGKFAELDVKEKIIPQWICPALNDAPGWYRPFNDDTKRFQL